jgi:hypothetical protein
MWGCRQRLSDDEKKNRVAGFVGQISDDECDGYGMDAAGPIRGPITDHAIS